MIKHLKDLSLHWRFMLAPIVGIVLTIILASLFFSTTAEQRKNLLLIQQETLGYTRTLSNLASRLASNHASVYELLKYATEEGDEARLYEMGKPLLNEVHRIESETRLITKQKLFSNDVFLKLLNYRKQIITAVEMSTVDLTLAYQYMTQATSEFNRVNVEFLNISQTMQSSIESQLVEYHISSEAKMHQYIVLFLIAIAAVITISVYLSKLLSGDLNKSIRTLSELSENKNEVDNSSEIIQLSQVINHVRDNHKKLDENRNDLIYQESQQRAILNNMVDGVITIDEAGMIMSFNRAAEKIFGYSADAVIGENINMMMPEADSIRHHGYIHNFVVTGHAHIIGIGREVEALRADKTTFPMHLSITELPVKSQNKRCFIGTCKDITNIKQQEEQLRRSQKMEALGKLTGGIAHDYNNMLGVVLGYADLLAGELKDQPKFMLYAEKITHAAERGVKLTSKLMSFSRLKQGEAQVLTLNQFLQQELHMLKTVLTAKVDVELDLSANLWPIQVDTGDLEDAVINICINAMHAMENGGNLNLRTENFVVQNNNAELLSLPVGEYVLLSINDTGSGMNEETMSKVFDPFYSTKGSMGTGLGLSQVYGFMQRSGGVVKVYSELGHGSRFSLYFPRLVAAGMQSKIDDENLTVNLKGDETILVVDDEVELLNLCVTVIQQQGYEVFKAESAAQALRVLETQQIDLLISDVIMPEMDGIELAKIVKKKYSETKIILISGFTDNRLQNIDDKSLSENLLHKPCNAQKLLKKVRETLDRSSVS